jgi:nucleoside phosphorylase
MRILIVDDNPAKRAAVADLLRQAELIVAPHIEEAECYESALEALRRSFFDLVILDLVLPAAGQEPSRQTSRAIIFSVLQGTSTVPPTHIIGLTAYGDIADEEEHFYQENLFALERYSQTDSLWERRLIGKINYLAKSKNAASHFKANNFDLDFVVMTARYENEFLPVVDQVLTHRDSDKHPGWPGRISLGRLTLPNGHNLRGAVCCIGEMGMAPAAALASQAIAEFRPRLLSMLGMCCGFRVDFSASPRKLMDVIIAREVDCWEEGKYVELARGASEFKSRSRARVVDDAIRADVEAAIEMQVETLKPAMQKLSRLRKFKKLRDHFGKELVRDQPDVQFAPLVSGSSVIADQSMIAEILARNPNALGLDMEMYGVYSAAEKCVGRRPSVLGIKGVADHGEVNKDDLAQYLASQASAVVFRTLLPHLSIF